MVLVVVVVVSVVVVVVVVVPLFLLWCVCVCVGGVLFISYGVPCCCVRSAIVGRHPLQHVCVVVVVCVCVGCVLL